MFIVIDWIDGSGKWTQTQRVRQELEKAWKTVKVLDYPRYWNKSAYFVEKYLNWWYWKEVNAKTASLFYALDRFDDYVDMEKDFVKYDYVISNRYVTASMIHQAGKISDLQKRDSFLEWLNNLEYEILWIKKPDKVVFLNVSPELSNSLVESKEKRDYIKDNKNKDIHEDDKNHMINAYIAANYVAKKFNWIVIECEKDWKIKSREEITEMILGKIDNPY